MERYLNEGSRCSYSAKHHRQLHHPRPSSSPRLSSRRKRNEFLNFQSCLAGLGVRVRRNSAELVWNAVGTSRGTDALGLDARPPRLQNNSKGALPARLGSFHRRSKALFWNLVVVLCSRPDLLIVASHRESLSEAEYNRVSNATLDHLCEYFERLIDEHSLDGVDCEFSVLVSLLIVAVPL